MIANAMALITIFEKKIRLEVPLFQRQYVWSLEPQWEPLWEDIARKFTEYLDGRKDAPVHFLGAMVLDQKQTPVTHVEKRQVIDGQQRLTTLQIFLAAFRDFCMAQACEDLGKECDGFTVNKGILAEPEVDKYKVWPTQLDREQFKDVIDSRSREELERRHPLTRKKYSRYPESRPRMVEAYFFFYDQLVEFFVGTQTEPPLAANVPLAQRLEECFHALKNSLKIVSIDLDKDDDAQIIFETLNARGQPLLPADLLRNYIFLRAARSNESQEKLYETYWARFDDEFWRHPVKQGRLLRPRSDLFMQHFLASRQGRDIPITHLFVEYKFWIERERPFPSVKDELLTLARQGDHFRRIIEPQQGDPLFALVTFLEAFDIRTIYPLLLALLDAEIDDTQWKAVSLTLESYLLRRAICGVSTKNYNRVFLALTRTLRQRGVSPEVVARHLMEQTGESAGWPSDEEFSVAWRSKNVYQSLNNQRLVYVFKRLNGKYMNKKMENLVLDDPLTVEHLMPQAWIEHWPLADGSKGMTLNELSSAPANDPVAVATQARNTACHTIGNLTILKQELNSAVSNSAWTDKKPELLLHSLLPINQMLHDKECWDEAAIAARGEALLEQALKLWPRS